jgi:hypothetical protein
MRQLLYGVTAFAVAEEEIRMRVSKTNPTLLAVVSLRAALRVSCSPHRTEVTVFHEE